MPVKPSAPPSTLANGDVVILTSNGTSNISAKEKADAIAELRYEEKRAARKRKKKLKEPKM